VWGVLVVHGVKGVVKGVVKVWLLDQVITGRDGAWTAWLVEFDVWRGTGTEMRESQMRLFRVKQVVLECTSFSAFACVIGGLALDTEAAKLGSG
jgi:hypothetical protein